MHHTVSRDSLASISIPAAWVAIATAATACALLLGLQVLSPESSPAWRMISEYANGRYSWVLSAMFTAYGVNMADGVGQGEGVTPQDVYMVGPQR